MTNKTEAFKRDCRILRMKQEYPGYSGDILWIVISDLTEEQILEMYPQEITPYTPFIHMTKTMYEPIADFENQKRLENIFTLISERDVTSYELAIVELNERISRIVEESSKLRIAIERIVTFGLDYTQMTEDQQYELGAYVNLMAASTQLLVNPILGLQPKYTENDCLDYFANTPIDLKRDIHMNRDLQIYLCNLLYKIELDKTDMKLLWKSFKKNKEFLASMELKKRDLDFVVVETAMNMLEYKYRSVEKK